MNADYNHDTAKRTVMECYDIHRPQTLNQWVVWIMELTHVYVWHEGGHTLGQGLPVQVKQFTVDETFWQQSRVDKSISSHAIGDPTWVRALVELYNNGKNGRCVFRIIKSRANAIDIKPTRTPEFTRFVRCHAWPGNLLVSDGTPPLKIKMADSTSEKRL